VRRWKRASADDVAFLSNRVTKLQCEVEKAWRRLSNARQAEERMNQVRTERTKISSQVQAERSKRAQMTQELKQRLAENRDRQRHRVFLARSKLIVQRREASSEVKREQHDQHRLLHAEQVAQAMRLAALHDAVAHAKQQFTERRIWRLESHQRARRKNHSEEMQLLMDEREREMRVAATLLASEAQLLHRLHRLNGETVAVTSRLLSSVDGERSATASSVPLLLPPTPSKSTAP
jgi:hypothetical protein